MGFEKMIFGPDRGVSTSQAVLKKEMRQQNSHALKQFFFKDF